MAKGKRYGVRRGEPGKDLNDEQGWPINSQKLYELFGIKYGSHIPPNFSGEKKVGDTMVYIVSQDVAKISKLKRRTIARCNHCERLVCAGHLNQHVRSHIRPEYTEPAKYGL